VCRELQFDTQAMGQVPTALKKLAGFIESQIPKSSTCPLKELSFWLIDKDGHIQSNANCVVEKVFQKGA